jgi:hypothetical protein
MKLKQYKLVISSDYAQSTEEWKREHDNVSIRP